MSSSTSVIRERSNHRSLDSVNEVGPTVRGGLPLSNPASLAREMVNLTLTPKEQLTVDSEPSVEIRGKLMQLYRERGIEQSLRNLTIFYKFYIVLLSLL